MIQADTISSTNEGLIPWLEKPFVSDKADNEYPLAGLVFYSTLVKEKNEKDLFYFDENLTYKNTKSAWQGMKPDNSDVIQNNNCLISKKGTVITAINGSKLNKAILYAVVKSLPLGTHFRDFVGIYNQVVTKHIESTHIVIDENAKEKQKKRYLAQMNQTETTMTATDKLMIEAAVPFGVYKTVTKIENPQIERETDNKDTHTFDFVRVTMTTVKMTNEQRKAFIRKYKKSIIRLILNRIKNYKHYQRFGIPINFLRLTSCTLTYDHSIVFLFELKNLFETKAED